MLDNFCPLVSIITPTYNHERFIGPCIETVLRQTHRNWEQIIIDDGSTDGTGDIVRRYSDPRIRYFPQKNLGIDALAQTYNCALSLSRGDLIAVLEGDDLWPAEKLATLVPHFRDPSLVLAYGAVVDVDVNGRKQSGRRRTHKSRPNLPSSVLSNNPIGSTSRFMLSALGPSLVPASTVVLRRSALEEIGGFQAFPGLRTTDYPTYFRLSLKGKFFYENRVMGFQRRHLGSVTITNLESGHLNASRCSRAFMQEYGRELSLTPADVTEIEDSWKKSRTLIEFSLGRVSLLNKDWRRARTHFGATLRTVDPQVWLASTAGWILSWLHLNLEAVMQRFGRAGLKK
jgi:glycosyltransferase involved in cell wall biosynthesis